MATQSQINLGAAAGSTDQQLLAIGATQSQVDAARLIFPVMPAAHPAAAHPAAPIDPMVSAVTQIREDLGRQAVDALRRQRTSVVSPEFYWFWGLVGLVVVVMLLWRPWASQPVAYMLPPATAPVAAAHPAVAPEPQVLRIEIPTIKFEVETKK